MAKDRHNSISQASVSRSIENVTNVIVQQLSHLIKFPTEVEEVNRVKREYTYTLYLYSNLLAI